ncbi:serine/threonine-protein kinase [Actinomadura harenae]|nr:serine/threonine-protein kinase [Actinomadura harenae]
MEPLRDADPRRVGRYRLVARLGGGGMGEVFLGSSPGGMTVAVKIVREHLLVGDPAFRERFAREVAAARLVGGFYTAQVVDADTDAEPPWLATAYIPGPSLYDAVRERGEPLPEHAVRVLGAGLAEGLAAVHDRGVVHRDLTPRNVILADGGPRIIDFGIARALDAAPQNPATAVLGTPEFMSPEQARGRRTGPSGDVFSLGSVLAFAATGRSPFAAESPLASLHRVIDDPPDLRGVPAGLRPLVAACLSKDADARPSVDDVLARLTSPAEAVTEWLPRDVADMVTDYRTRTSSALRPTRVYTEAPPGKPERPKPKPKPKPKPAARPAPKPAAKPAAKAATKPPANTRPPSPPVKTAPPPKPAASPSSSSGDSDNEIPKILAGLAAIAAGIAFLHFYVGGARGAAVGDCVYQWNNRVWNKDPCKHPIIGETSYMVTARLTPYGSTGYCPGMVDRTAVFTATKKQYAVTLCLRALKRN